MFPILYQYKFLSIGGYGVMLGLGFYLAFLLFERELKIREINPELAYKILLVAIPTGIIGSKLFHILEHMDDFLRYPMEMIFSGAGLSAYGGFIFAFIGCAYVIWKSKEDILTVCDAVSPSLALGYCFGRFGCHIAGDGCYGIAVRPYHLFNFTATTYPNGIVPISTPVFPTPLFEVFFSFFALGLLLQMRRKDWSKGTLFFTYLLLNAIPRFLVEFIRLNPVSAIGLTQAQFIAILFAATGIIGLVLVHKKAPQQS